MAERGFTYIELIVTLAIMAVLVMVAVPSMRYMIQKQKEYELRLALAQIRQGIDSYKHAADVGRIQKDVDATGYPPRLNDLVSGVPDQTAPDHHKLYFLRSLPADPFFADSTADPASTWGLRSYASPPDAPVAGSDVFDVYSLSTQTGLNGIPYKRW
jgi:general secretion pathway protein G